MLIGNRSKFIDYWSRANTGPICFEDDFDKKIYWPKLKEITKRWEIVYDPKHQVPTDDDMLDRLWQAAIDMVVEVGVLCVDTRRIMHFTRKEIEDLSVRLKEMGEDRLLREEVSEEDMKKEEGDGHTWDGTIYQLCADGIAIIVNTENTVTNLTTEQLKNIYTGVVENWSDLNA